MMESYEKMLEKVYKELPQEAKEKKRFKLPVFESFIQGNNTFISNFIDVADEVRRDPKHLMKFLCKECATSANIDKKRLIMKGRFREKQLNDKLVSYIREYVLCSACKKPDTSLVEFEGVDYIRCEACGARNPVRVIK